MSNTVFISHSVKDKEVVEAVVDLLRNGMEIRKSEIFCTSLEGSIGIGEEFIGRIRKEIRECEVVILLMSPAYMDSFFCCVECGAAWALGKNVKPLLIPPLTFADLQNPMDKSQAIMIHDKKGIGQLFTEMKEAGVATANIDDFYLARENFLKRIEEITTKPKAVVSTGEQDKIFEVKVTEIYPKGDGNFLRIEQKIDKEVLEKLGQANLLGWEEEQHWLDNQFQTIKDVQVGSKIRLRVVGGKFYPRVLHGTKQLYNVRNIYFKLV